jgi:hypothetical protein
VANPSDMTDDDALLGFLRPFAKAHDGLPPAALEQASSAFRFVSQAEPVAYRSLDDLELVGARASSAVRVIEFDMPAIDGAEPATVSIEFIGSRLIGHAASGGLSGASWRTPKAEATADRIDDGSFEFDEFPAGPFCLLLDVHGREIQTDWILGH